MALVTAKTKRRAKHGARRFGVLLWRYRAGLAPFWAALLLALAGWLLVGRCPPEVPALAALLMAAVVWFGGEQMSPRVQAAWMWLVPDSADAGRKGVLDRPTERGYLAGLLLFAGGWLWWRLEQGWVEPVRFALIAATGCLGVPWWWHRGWRRKRPVSKWVRLWKHVAGSDVTALKPWAGSRVVEVGGDRRKAPLLTVQLKRGLQIAHVGGTAASLCSAMGLRPGAVTVAADPNNQRRVRVRIVPADPWGRALLHPLPAPGSLLIADHPRVQVGLFEDATVSRLKLAQHMLCCGRTGSGKSIFLEALLVWLLAFRDVRVVAADLASGATFGLWEPVFCAPLATNVRDAMDLIDRVFAVIEDRERELDRRKRAGELIDALPPTEDMPWLFFLIDEFPDLVKAAKAAGHDTVLVMLERLANKGRKVGVWLVLGAQNPTTKDVGSTELRGALTAIVGLGLNPRQSLNLWQSDRDNGWDSAGLAIGTHLLQDSDPEHREPRVAKGLFVPKPDRLDLIRAASQAPARLDRRGQVFLDGGQPGASPAIGETARLGTYEETPPAVESPRPRLSIVPPPPDEVTPRGAGGAVRGQETGPPREVPGVRLTGHSGALDGRVLGELPGSHQSGVGASGIAEQLGVDRGVVERSLRRLKAAGLAQHTGKRGGWVRG